MPDPSASGPLPPFDQVSRREALQLAGGLVSLLALGQRAGAQPAPDHYVQLDKGLTPEWLRGLRAPGAPTWYRGAELNPVGMPIGGIGTGQLYLRGDGTLAAWRIFNRATGGQPPVEQGFALRIESATGAVTRRLSRAGFADTEFCGEYPLATVRYRAGDTPLQVDLTAYSPFIPLNAPDSGLPATVFDFELHNAGTTSLKVGVLGWLENAVGLNTGPRIGAGGQRTSARRTERGRSLVVHGGAPVTLPADGPGRPTITVADFEGATYGDWTATGDAFGKGPASGTLANQQPVSGFLGKGLVNTFIAGDGPQGTLTSPPFKLERRCLNFLIGGGSHAGRTCMELLVGDKVVRSATGRDKELLEWHSWDVREIEGQEVRLRIADRDSGPWGHVNIDQIEQADQPRGSRLGPFDKAEDFGTLVLALAEPAADATATQAALPNLGVSAEVANEARFGLGERRLGALLSPVVELVPGARRKVRYVLAWHFPNAEGGNGQFYASRHADAAAVAHYVLDEGERLARLTRLWRDTWYDSTLPRWLLDRLHMPVSTLATGTCVWYGNGRFWAWEGVHCCEGTCTHVWNYAHAAARLFPELERSARTMQDFGAGFDARSGLVGFRGNRAYAADGQCGTILKALREHQMSPDSGWLKAQWPNIKKAIEFLLSHDANDDGLIEDSQHNTYDINFVGANTFVGALYLGALRAGEEMARELGDAEFAARLAKVCASGSKLTLERLWNGEYFIQEVDLAKHPKHQYGPGCLADQMFGQGWAHHVGLGYLYPREQVVKALESVWRYCWSPNVGPQTKAHPPQRWFLKPDEPGLLICTWPKSKHLGKDSVLYRDEVWTGIEYQVAGHMVWEGMLDEALAICRTVHDRYQPGRGRNPYNEIECGDHYARALASWGVFTALCGHTYHGPHGQMAFAPRLSPERFRAAFTAAEGWGTFEQTRDATSQRVSLRLAHGRLRLKRLDLAAPTPLGATVTATLGGAPVTLTARRDGADVVLAFANEVVLDTQRGLEVTLR